MMDEQFLIRLTCNAVWAASMFLLAAKIAWGSVRAKGAWRSTRDPAVWPGAFLSGVLASEGGRAFFVWLDLRTNPAIQASFEEDYTLPALFCGTAAICATCAIHTLTPETNRPWPGLVCAALIAAVAASQWFGAF